MKSVSHQVLLTLNLIDTQLNWYTTCWVTYCPWLITRWYCWLTLLPARKLVIYYYLPANIALRNRYRKVKTLILLLFEAPKTKKAKFLFRWPEIVKKNHKTVQNWKKSLSVTEICIYKPFNYSCHFMLLFCLFHTTLIMFPCF